MKINKHYFKKLSLLSLLLPLVFSSGCQLDTVKNIFLGPIKPSEYKDKSIFEYVKAQDGRISYSRESNVKAETDDGHVKRIITACNYDLKPVRMRKMFDEHCHLNKGIPIDGFCYDKESYYPKWAVLFTEIGWYGIAYDGVEAEGSAPEILFGGESYEIHAYGYSKSEDDPKWLSFVKAKGGYTHDEIKALYDTSAIDDTSVRKELIKQCADTIGKESERSKELADKCNMLINPNRVNEEGKSSIGKREHHEVLRQNLKTIDNINNLLLSLPR